MEVKFIKSSAKIEQCPEGSLPEIAFVGRSNVGKSSLINMLLNRKKLAMTSAKPGKTRLINHFLVDSKWYLVDLPGFGYAQVSQKQRAKFEQIIYNYLKRREQLRCVFLLIDIRIPPQKKDLEFFNYLGQADIPFSIIFTKAEKSKATRHKYSVEAFKQEVLKQWDDMPDYFVSSAKDKSGQEEILAYIKDIVNEE